MINKEYIIQLVDNKLNGSTKFVVEVKVKPGNKIEILLDDDNNVSINDCIELSRFVESNFDREKEDFELSVMSAGVGEPFKVKRQYVKNVGRQVELFSIEGIKHTGKLLAANESEIILETKGKIRKENKKDSSTQLTNLVFSYDQIKQTKVVLSF
jgi:ribosome maturation factor RimP